MRFNDCYKGRERDPKPERRAWKGWFIINGFTIMSRYQHTPLYL